MFPGRYLCGECNDYLWDQASYADYDPPDLLLGDNKGLQYSELFAAMDQHSKSPAATLKLPGYTPTSILP